MKRKFKRLTGTFIFALIGLVVIVSCMKDEISVSNLNNNIIKVIGHGGMGVAHNYPMNSYPSVMRALSIGADGVEIDVQMTSDGVLVAFHDYDMSERSTGSGNIYMQTWEEIEGTTYLDPLYTDYAVMRLDSMISGIPEREEVIFVLDCKNFNPDTSALYLETFTDRLLGVLDTFNLDSRVIVEFKRTDLIETMRRKRPGLDIFFLGDHFGNSLATALEYELPGITVSIDLISTDQVREAHRNGVMISVFDVSSRSANQQAVKMNVDFIQTDDPGYLINLLRGVSQNNHRL